MSRETYEEHITKGGADVDPARVRAFSEHRVRCAVCSTGTYRYLECSEGRRLAHEATRRRAPLDNQHLRG